MRGRWTTTWKGGGSSRTPSPWAGPGQAEAPKAISAAGKEEGGLGPFQKKRKQQRKKRKRKKTGRSKKYIKIYFAPDNKLEHPKMVGTILDAEKELQNENNTLFLFKII